MLDMEFRAALLVWLGGYQPALVGTPATDLTGRSILKAATSERNGTHTAVMRVIAEITEKAGMQHAWEVKDLFGPFSAAAAEGKTKGENRRIDLVFWDRAIRWLVDFTRVDGALAPHPGLQHVYTHHSGGSTASTLTTMRARSDDAPSPAHVF